MREFQMCKGDGTGPQGPGVASYIPLKGDGAIVSVVSKCPVGDVIRPVLGVGQLT